MDSSNTLQKRCLRGDCLFLSYINKSLYIYYQINLHNLQLPTLRQNDLYNNGIPVVATEVMRLIGLPPIKRAI